MGVLGRYVLEKRGRIIREVGVAFGARYNVGEFTKIGSEITEHSVVFFMLVGTEQT